MMGIDMAEDMLNYKLIIMVSKTLTLHYFMIMISEWGFDNICQYIMLGLSLNLTFLHSME